MSNDFIIYWLDLEFWIFLGRILAMYESAFREKHAALISNHRESE